MIASNPLFLILDFNPRSHEGSDNRAGGAAAGADISIHAPTRGATFWAAHASGSVRFQSTLPRGERHGWSWRQCSLNLFQSTLPRGERHHPSNQIHRRSHFNPRSHEGSDRHPVSGSLPLSISIHAPTRGATFRNARGEPIKYQFQSTLPRGERPESRKKESNSSKFQSTLPRGERLLSA